MTSYVVYDVFTENAFGGNQLAVIPDARELPEEDLQRIAREFNFSETTFVFPPKDAQNTAKVRIFTPTMEIPFAGHPVIGTACALHDRDGLNDMIFELGVGNLPCTIKDKRASFVTNASLEIVAEPEPKMVADALGISATDISFGTHAPIMATLGLAFTFTEVKDRLTLSKLVPDTTAMRKGRDAYPSSLDFAQFAYVRDETGFHGRMFAPLDNIPEDPATGSACATLGALLAQIHNSDQSFTVIQGEDMGRRSEIAVKAGSTSVTVSGTARRTMEGQLVYR